MCEFTVYLDGHDDKNIVAESVVKAILKTDVIVLLDSKGETTRVLKAHITKVDSIMAEMLLKTNE